jgi:hypothetical protein
MVPIACVDHRHGIFGCRCHRLFGQNVFSAARSSLGEFAIHAIRQTDIGGLYVGIVLDRVDRFVGIAGAHFDIT